MEMDLAQLAGQAAAFLAPYLPYLVKGGKIAAKKAFEKAGEIFSEEAWEQVEKLWGRLRPKVEKKEAAKEAVQEIIETPKDEEALFILQRQIRKILAEDPQLRQETQLIVGQIGNLSYAQASNGSVAVGRSIEHSLIAMHGSQIVNNYYQSNPNADREDLQKQIVKYLQWVEEYFRLIELRGIVVGESPVIRLELDKVYVPLQAVFQQDTDGIPPEFSGGNPKQRQSEARLERQNREISLDQILQLGNRLIVTGGPGCGKTTVLQHIAWNLAKSWLDHSDRATAKLGIEPPYPLPIYVPLNLYAVHLRSHKNSPAKHRTLAHFISEYLIQNQTNLPNIDTDFFAFLLQDESGVVLLLDGLDEVPTEDERIIVREDIEKLVAGKENLRAVVTSRTAAYYGEAIFGRGFRHIRVLPLEQAHINSLVGLAYDCQFPSSPAHARHEAQALLDGIRRLEEERQRVMGGDVEPLVDSPLMVRMFLIVAANERVLPNQRADLYQKTVDAMLRSENILDKKVAVEISQRVGGGIAVHREMLQYLAFDMHRRGKQGKEIDEDTLIAILKATPHAAYSQDLVSLTRQRGTVLDFRGGVYRFFHLSFQEFLAARYLADNLRGIEKIVQFLVNGPVTDTWWREPVLLLCGYLDMNANSQAGELLRQLAGLEKKAFVREKEIDLQLACAEAAGAAMLECQLQPPDLGKQIAARLVALIEDKASAKPQLRAAAGDTLARLGDPRFDDETWCLPKEKLFGFVHIPAGEFLMGTKGSDLETLLKKYGGDKDWYLSEVPLHPLTLPDYYLARYPVTVAQFKAFVIESGYEPGNEASLQGVDNHPVRYVTWFDAVAYCDWLDQKLKAIAPGKKAAGETEKAFWQGLEDGRLRVTLPSEAEWEKAARGTPLLEGEGRVRAFPWGNEITPNHANYNETGLGSTCAVGCFPRGTSPYGLLDLSGNVWEWTRSIYKEYPYQPDKGRETMDDKKSVRVLRGGAFNNNGWDVRCASRGGASPSFGWLNLGFRVVVASPISLPRSGS